MFYDEKYYDDEDPYMFDDEEFDDCVFAFNNVKQNKIQKNKKGEGKKMMRGLERKFNVEKNEEIKLTFRGTKAVPTEDGYISFENNGLTNNQNMVMDMDGCFYEVPCDKNTLTKGDLVIINGEYLFFIDKNEYIGADGTVKRINNINDVLLGNLSNIITKVVSVFDNNGNGNGNIFNFNNNGNNNFGDMLLMKEMLSGKDGEGNMFESMLKMKMMSNIFGQNNNNNNQNIFGNMFGFNQPQEQLSQVEVKQKTTPKKKKRNKK